MDDATRTELEAAAFRALRDHLRAHPEVQNIDLMNLAGFCRNCLARWYDEAASARGIALGKEAAREIVYGMPYAEWVAKHQFEAGPEAMLGARSAPERLRPLDRRPARLGDIDSAQPPRHRPRRPSPSGLPSTATTAVTKAEAAVMKASAAPVASATVKGRSSTRSCASAASRSTAARVMPCRIAFESSGVTIAPSRVTM